MAPNQKRNRQLVERRDKRGLSFRVLAAMFDISPTTAFEIYHRETVKNGSNKRISAFIVQRYPKLFTAS